MPPEKVQKSETLQTFLSVAGFARNLQKKKVRNGCKHHSEDLHYEPSEVSQIQGVIQQHKADQMHHRHIYLNVFFSSKCFKNCGLMVFLQGANILLTDKGDVKLGKLLVIFTTFGLHVITSHSATKTNKSCRSSFQPTLELQPK